MSSDDLLERYLDEVSGTRGRYRMSFRNSKNMLKTLKNSASNQLLLVLLIKSVGGPT